MYLRNYVPLLGRLLMSAIFLVSGLSKLTGWSQTEAYMASERMPAIPFLLLLAILIEMGGGLALLVGWKPRQAATLLFLYLIPTTLVFHDFWAVDGSARMIQLVQFLKNLGIMGGLLIVAHVPETYLRAHEAREEGERYPSLELPPRRAA